MSTHNISFHGEIKETSVLSGEKLSCLKVCLSYESKDILFMKLSFAVTDNKILLMDNLLIAMTTFTVVPDKTRFTSEI